MSSEMWSRDHIETGRCSPSSNSHHSSIIHTLISISGMRTFILKWYSFFMPQAAYGCIYFDKRHLCLQHCKGIFCTLNTFKALRVKPIHVLDILINQTNSWISAEHAHTRHIFLVLLTYSFSNVNRALHVHISRTKMSIYSNTFTPPTHTLYTVSLLTSLLKTTQWSSWT